MRKLLVLLSLSAFLLGKAWLCLAQNVMMPNITAAKGNYVIVPVFASDLNANIRSFQTNILYNPAVGVCQTFSVEETILPPSSNTLYNLLTPGTIQGGSIMTNLPYSTPEGVLVYFLFKISPDAVGSTGINFSLFFFNEAHADTTNGSITITNNPVIARGYCYYNTGSSVNDAITVAFYNNNGFIIDSTITNEAGFFTNELPAGVYDILYWSEGLEEPYYLTGLDISINPTIVPDRYLGLEQFDREMIPSVYALRENYPNPFNPTTTIAFDIPVSCDVKLAIHNIMGDVVTVLHKGRLQAGSYRTVFSGANLPSGIYFCKLDAGVYTQTRKMLLTK